VIKRLNKMDTRLNSMDTRLDGMDTRLNNLENEVSSIKWQNNAIHNELSDQFERVSAGRFEFAAKSIIPKCLILTECRKRVFPLHGTTLSASFAAAIAKMPLGNVEYSRSSPENQYTQFDSRLSLVGKAEADLFFKFFSPYAIWPSSTTFQSPEDSPMSATSFPSPSVNSLTFPDRSAKLIFTGCAVAEVCRSMDIWPSKFDATDRSFQKLAFKFLQLERAISACNRYYAGRLLPGCPAVQFAALLSPSFAQISGSQAAEAIELVFAFLGSGSLPFLAFLHSCSRFRLL
jgi:hypothetical protein